MSIRNPEIDRLLMEERLTNKQVAERLDMPVEDVYVYVRRTFQQALVRRNNSFQRYRRNNDEKVT